MPEWGQGSVHFGHRTKSFWVRGGYHRWDYCFLGSGKEMGLPQPRGFPCALSRTYGPGGLAAARGANGAAETCCYGEAMEFRWPLVLVVESQGFSVSSTRGRVRSNVVERQLLRHWWSD